MTAATPAAPTLQDRIETFLLPELTAALAAASVPAPIAAVASKVVLDFLTDPANAQKLVLAAGPMPEVQVETAEVTWTDERP